jgi:peptidoglycan/xylan/chitin deacetylase (PgdA/CDA1 family)
MIKALAKKLVAGGAIPRPVVRLVRKFKVGATVIAYHGVVDEIIDPRVQSLVHITLKTFQEQIRYLRDNYELVTLDYLQERVKSATAPDASLIALTFDDGYKSVVRDVAPYLSAEGIPFAVFVSTKHVEDSMRFPT